jgi:RNA polymerase-binding transcription factor
MTGVRYAELNEKLEGRRRELQRNLAVRLRDVRAPDDDDRRQRGGADEADAANADLEQDIDIALIQMRAATLRCVRDALARLETGGYGCCAECGDEIAEKRLNALPFAVRCRECEEACETADRRSRRLAGRNMDSEMVHESR